MTVPMTPREKQVAKIIYEGRLTEGIAEILGVSPRTVEVHRIRLMEKFGVSNTHDLVHSLRTYLEEKDPLVAAHKIINDRHVWRIHALENRLSSIELKLTTLLNLAAQGETESTRSPPDGPNHLER